MSDSLSRKGSLKSRVTSDCLKLVRKVPVVNEKLTMVLMIGGMVDEICFKRKVEMESRSLCLLEEAWKILEISSILAGGKDEKTVGLCGNQSGVELVSKPRGEVMIWGGFEVILRWRIDTLSNKSSKGLALKFLFAQKLLLYSIY